MAIELLRGERSGLDLHAAELVADALGRRLGDSPHAVLGVVGGRSVGGIFAALRSKPLSWDRLHVFLADERLVPVTSDESNWKLVEADLLSGPLSDGRMPRSNAHPYPFDPADPAAGRAIYDDQLRAVGGGFDVAILSAGEDGHTASLFPDHPSVREEAPGFVLVERSPKPPPRRISASRRLLEATSLGILVFYGEEKRDALARFLDETVPVEACPSKLVGAMRRAVVLTDLA